jgi:hypothetical protein
MTSRQFDRWWRHFDRRAQGEGCHEITRRLRSKLKRIRVADRPAFVRKLWPALLQDWHAYGVALQLLSHLREVERLHEMVDALMPLPGLQGTDEEAHLADLMRILAASDVPTLLEPVECYLLERPIGPYWETVPWALWPHRQQTFARAWQRYLVDVRPTDWKPTEVLESFLSEPDAVRVVRAEIAGDHPDDWNSLRDALRGEAEQVGWLSDEQRASLNQVIF